MSRKKPGAEPAESKHRAISETCKQTPSPSTADGALEAAQMWAVRTLAMGIAHDLRNILTTIRLEADESAAFPGQLNAARQVDRLYALTHSLLALSDDADLHFGPVDLSEIIDFVFRLFVGQADIDGVSLQKSVPCATPIALGNPRRLEHLFVNLLLNALNALAPGGGVITVTLRCLEDRVYVDITDNGPGIPPESLPKLFDPFFTTRANRTGLGLFSARRIVEAHHGEIMVSSRPGEGTCVTVWLPAANPGRPPSAAPAFLKKRIAARRTEEAKEPI